MQGLLPTPPSFTRSPLQPPPPPSWTICSLVPMGAAQILGSGFYFSASYTIWTPRAQPASPGHSGHGFPHPGVGGGGGGMKEASLAPTLHDPPKDVTSSPVTPASLDAPPPNPFSPPSPFSFTQARRGGGGNPQIPDPAKKVRKNSEEAPDLGRDGWKWERVCHAASSGRAPSRPQRALTHASRDDRTEGNGGDPAGLSLGRNPAFFVCSGSHRGQLFIHPRFGWGGGWGGWGEAARRRGLVRPSWPGRGGAIWCCN